VILKMNILKSVLIILLSVSFLINLYLAFKIIDSAISSDHQAMQTQYEAKSSSEELELIHLLLVDNFTRQEITALANKLSAKGAIVKNRENFLQIGRLEIIFDGDKVERVERF